MVPSRFLLVLSLLVFSMVRPRAEDRPNIVLILADDLGWADLPCYGNRFHETPAIDALAREGMRFTQFYSAAVCSPTRSNLQSGRHEARYGITQHIPGHRRPFAKLATPEVPLQLPLEVETIAERLGAAGYATAHLGKWHLGGEGFGPAEQGWQTVVEAKGHDTTAGGATRRTAEYLTEQAIGFMEEQGGKPFLLQVSHYAVHIPLRTEADLLVKYKAKEAAPDFPSRPDYAALLEELDRSVAGIVGAVDRLGLREKTVVFFLSDNGGLVHTQSGEIITSNAPLRAEKGTLYEGGIRVPAIARMPGFIPAGSVCDAPALSTDLYPTWMELAGLPAADPGTLDGTSLVPLLKDPAATVPRDALFWHLPHYHHSTPASAIRLGDWKLLDFFEDKRLELYDLSADPGETRNLTTERADQSGKLLKRLEQWRSEIGARLPTPNPAYDPARAAELGKGKKGGAGD